MSEEVNSNAARSFWLKGVRLSFTDSLKDAKPTVKGGVPKHGCNVLIEPGSKHEAENKAKVLAALEACGEQEWKKKDKYKKIAENDPKRVAFRKGERFTNSETDEVYKGYEGCMVIPGSGPGGNKNPKRPVIIDRGKNKIWAPDQGFEHESKIPDVCYSGTYADVKVEYYPVSGADRGGDGIFAAFQVIRSHQKGERMAGGYTFSDSDLDELDDLEDDDDAFDNDGDAGSAGDDDDFG